LRECIRGGKGRLLLLKPRAGKENLTKGKEAGGASARFWKYCEGKARRVRELKKGGNSLPPESKRGRGDSSTKGGGEREEGKKSDPDVAGKSRKRKRSSLMFE